MRLLGNNQDILPNSVPTNNEMGVYQIQKILFSTYSFFFCMLASHYGVVVQRDKVALSYVFLLRSMIAGSVHADM